MRAWEDESGWSGWGGVSQPWNEGQPPRQGKKMKASAAEEGVVLTEMEEGLALVQPDQIRH